MQSMVNEGIKVWLIGYYMCNTSSVTKTNRTTWLDNMTTISGLFELSIIP